MKRKLNHFLKIALLVIATVFFFSSQAHAWWNKEWTIRKRITIDNTANASGITTPIGATTVLVRMADYDFGAGKEDGSDIRIFAEDDKTPLPYHIEKFDSLLGEAFVWVKVPELKPGAQTSIWLYYGNNGNITAPGGGDPKTTYDQDTTLVYHFAESGAAAHDISGQGNDSQGQIAGTASLIGPGLRLTGKVPVTIPASTSLNWAEGAPMTWSAWIKPAALQANAVIFSRRDGGKDFVVGIDNGIPFVQVNGTRSSAGTPITAASWHHLAVTAEGSTITLYLDGASYGTLSAALPAMTGVSLIGGDSSTEAPVLVGFSGEMDELEIAKVVKSPGWIKFAAMSQGAESTKVVAVATDEQAPAGFLSGAFGLFGVILKSVTIDGWVVIAILGVMSVVSWYVMFTKFFYIKQVKKGNAAFLKEWRHVAQDLTSLDHTDTGMVKSMGGRAGPKVQKQFANSSLYRIYHIGSVEIGHRMPSGPVLSSRSIQAIRAALDGGYVRENHSLNDGCVFLTISIAGGPFMGLLGTVVGVMITFAAIAATGEVNISAIAPGLAAALVATVAGLLVAIPALLGYNYLVSEMKTITNDMQIFIDEFVTKMAEFYSPAEVESGVSQRN